MSSGSHEVRVYYEDTDHSGLVYHANYLRYFERGREHLLGPDELVSMLNTSGVGFVVYKANLQFKAGAKFGDVLDIRSTVGKASPWRLTFDQRAFRRGEDTPLVIGDIDLCCVDRDGKLVKVPQRVLDRLQT